ncbi:hypothetical protein F443_01466 [Phytophthora nicotianae P1569]|uniref:Integrase catalytic domain-containing protein n=1 Tax=Phytophthora nicotianae P1569 TaxID=1317065 RepID=V9FWL5_PHYNI|nr:hypothetical protein F443_01466 [Phytophthora nicotianae P1569]
MASDNGAAQVIVLPPSIATFEPSPALPRTHCGASTKFDWRKKLSHSRAFATPDGLFEYLVTPMGISSSPSSFNRLVCSIFADYSTFCQTYFDDLFVFTETEPVTDHLEALETVLERCAQENLYSKIQKCVFCQPEIPCLGDYIGRDGIRMDPKKADSIHEWPIPETKREMQSFIGTCVYVMRFCQGFADQVALLTEIIRDKRPGDGILTSPPVLAHPDFTRPLYVNVDASDFAIGVYIYQLDDNGTEKVIAYFGRKLSKPELVYPTREKELLAALHFLSGFPVNPMWWPTRFLGARAGTMLRADVPRRLCVPASPGLRKKLLFEDHDVPTRGHPGQAKTLLLLLEKYYWKGMAHSVDQYVSSCELCQRNKSVRGKPPSLLHPLDIPSNRWEDISMDLLSPLPTTPAGFDAVLVIVDRLIKRTHFLPTHSTATASATAQLFCNFHQHLHGLPLSIVSDRDPRFTSALWPAIMDLQETQLHLSTAFNPSTDGQSEATIKFVGEYLRHFVRPHHDNWDSLLPLTEFAYNSRTIRELIHQLACRRSWLILATTFVSHQQAILAEAQDAMAAAQLQWHAAYDRNRPQLTFAIGDEVLLDTKNLDLAHMDTDGKRKLAVCFIGPYRVVNITGPDTYALDLPPGLRLHPDYHVSRPRRYHSDHDPHRTTRVQPILVANGSVDHLVAAILRHRIRRGVRQFEVQWLDSTIQPSWEPLDNLMQVLTLVRHYVDGLSPTQATARLKEGVSRVQPVRSSRTTPVHRTQRQRRATTKATAR